MQGVRKIELLAPAKNLECGIEAVNHGADAVYIGAPKFGARAAAGNSLEDIAALIDYAQQYQVRVYVTINTLLKEEELREAEELIGELYRIGTDALIIQDLGITRLNIPPIPLHASTQTDNRTPEKVKFLADAGISRVVLARELSLNEIREIHEATPVPLEIFVHGSLCTGYSGQCYVSQACFGRSANRGECAQFCRLPFNLVDAEGNIMIEDKHLLSLKDLNRSNELEGLLDAGVSSLKIEGRLKDVSYVKNITAFYRQKLDALFARRHEYVRASSGTCTYYFTPSPEKSFNRGFTSYFLRERSTNIQSFNSPKSLGEEMGTVKEVHGNYLLVAGIKSFNNGDGVCYLDEREKMQGFRINRVEESKLYPQEMPDIKPRTLLYRNYDQEFERVLSYKSAERKMPVSILLTDNDTGISLTFTNKDGVAVTIAHACEKVPARTPQTESRNNILAKLGDTPFTAEQIDIKFSDNWFIPASVLTELRRQTAAKLITARGVTYQRMKAVIEPTSHPYPQQSLSYLGNVMNSQAATFYREHGVTDIQPAYEQEPVKDAVLMFCKHCLRYSMGLCPTLQKGRSPFTEPYYLMTKDGKRFRLSFDCKNCLMEVTRESRTLY